MQAAWGPACPRAGPASRTEWAPAGWWPEASPPPAEEARSGDAGPEPVPGGLSGLCPRQAPWLPPPGPGPGPRQGTWGSRVGFGGRLLMVTLGLDQQPEPRGSSCPELGTCGFLEGRGSLSPHQPRVWWGLRTSRPRPRLWPWQRKWQDRASAGAGSGQPRGHSPVTGCVGWGSVFPGTGGLGGAPQVPPQDAAGPVLEHPWRGCGAPPPSPRRGAAQLSPTCWPGHMALGSPDSWPGAGRGDGQPILVSQARSAGEPAAQAQPLPTSPLCRGWRGGWAAAWCQGHGPMSGSSPWAASPGDRPAGHHAPSLPHDGSQ